MKRRVIFILSAFAALGILYFISTISFIEIGATGFDKSMLLSVKIENQAGKGSSEFRVSSSEAKRLVGKGTYEVFVSQNGKSNLSMIKTKGFLRISKVNIKLEPERSRKFIGSNPKGCMFYSDLLYSYDCQGAALNNIYIHNAATADSPAFVTKNDNGTKDTIESVAKTKEGLLALVRIAGQQESQSSPGHAIYILGDKLKPLRVKVLAELDKTKSYSIKPYKAGFLAYDSGFEKVLYFASSTSSGQQMITVKRPQDAKLSPYRLDVQAENILVAYTNAGLGNYLGQNPGNGSKSPRITIQIYIYNGGTTRTYSFSGLFYQSAALCGFQKLCLLGDKVLYIYDISSPKAKLAYKLTNVNSFESLDGAQVILRLEGIFNFDIDKRTGYLEYSFGAYQPCGITKDGSNYLVCLVDAHGRSSVLSVDRSSPDKDSIDKKVAALQKLSGVSDVSIYGKYIYIVPELGPLVYDNALRSYTYNPTTKKSVNGKINQEIDKLGIDRKTYTIINTSE